MIRPALRADLEGLLDLWEALMVNGMAADPRFRTTPDARAHMRSWMLNSWFEQRPFPHALVWDDGGPCAVIHGFPTASLPVIDHRPTVRIGDLFVATTHRRRGIGRDLVARLLQEARDAGFPRSEVGTLAKDTRAIQFWKSQGFGPWQVHFRREPEGSNPEKADDRERIR